MPTHGCEISSKKALEISRAAARERTRKARQRKIDSWDRIRAQFAAARA